MYFMCSIYRDKWFHIKKEVSAVSKETLTVALSEMQ